MPASREQVCKSTSEKLTKALPRLGQIRAVLGLDGFVDEIISVVERRQDFDHFDAVPTIARLAEKISAAVGQSSSYELVVKQMKLGGNGPIMANAMACAGLDITYIGNLGDKSLHPVFADFATRAKIISIAEPGHTDALEFNDGKVMLGKISALKDINWDTLMKRVGLDRIKSLVSGATLIGTVNWTMLPAMNDIWRRLRTDILPGMSGPRKMVFVDLADPEKRTPADIKAGMDELTALADAADVMLGLNLKESSEILTVLGLPAPANAEAAIEASARAIREKIKIACVVIHPRAGAAAATAEGSASIAGPFVEKPRLSTGAGDNFNGGFCLGRILGLDLAESLCTGVATSGFYVRNAHSPSGSELAKFIAELPPPQS